MYVPLFLQVTAAAREGDTVKLVVEPAKGGDSETLEADVVLVSAGSSFPSGISHHHQRISQALNRLSEHQKH